MSIRGTTGRWWTAAALLAAGCAIGGCWRAGEPSPASLPVKEGPPLALATRTLVVGTAPPKAAVTLEPLLSHEAPLPATPAYMDQSGQMFVPDFLIARAGQIVQFRSSEDVLHNVRVNYGEARTPIFNVATPPWGIYRHTFENTGFYNVSCDIHATMRALILITSAPHAAIADETGSFVFHDVAPGSYKLKAFVRGEQAEHIVHISGTRTDLKL